MSRSSVLVRLRWLWLLLLLGAVSAGASAGIGHFRSSADRARQAEFALLDARAELNVAARGSSFRSAVAGAQSSLRTAERAEPGTAVDVRVLARQVTRYREAAAAELRALGRGDRQQAARIARERVSPALAAANRWLARAVQVSERRREHAEDGAVLGVRLIVIAVALVMLLALSLYARARASALRSELEQESLRWQVAARGFEADHDDLTGLLNRRGFFARLRGRIADDDSGLAVLVLDLDGFKEINDTLGHEAGDELLAQIGPRLRETLREHDVLGRLGGDEFAILTTGAHAAEQAREIGRRIRAALVAPFEVAGLALQVRASVGIAHASGDGCSAEELVRRADIAMYQAKRGREGVAVYAATDDPRVDQRLRLASELERALRNDELVVHYQPKVEMATGAVSGVEALVRWQHPQRGLLAPDVFVPVAERSGLIRQLTLEVVRQALAQQARWRSEGIDLSMAINLSIANLLDNDLPNEIARLLADHAGRPERLRVEITESYLVTDPTLIHSNLDRLCTQGIRLALDDFGTGYSSFTHLRRLPIDELKIDRSFIDNLDHDDDDTAIVRSTIDLAHSLKLCVVAEGVETEAVWNQLRELGCDQAQGFYLSPPLPAQRLTGWLLNQAPAPTGSARTA